MTINQIAAATLDEATAYYRDGGRYIYEGRAYTLRRYHAVQERIATAWASLNDHFAFSSKSTP